MKPTGKKIKDEVRVYVDKKGDVVGMAHEVSNLEAQALGRKTIEMEISQEAVSGRKTDDAVVLPKEFRDRIMDHKDPLRPQDLDVRGGIKVRRDREL